MENSLRKRGYYDSTTGQQLRRIKMGAVFHTCRLVEARVRGGSGGQRGRGRGAVKQLPARRWMRRLRWLMRGRVGCTSIGWRRLRWSAGRREHLETTCWSARVGKSRQPKPANASQRQRAHTKHTKQPRQPKQPKQPNSIGIMAHYFKIDTDR